MNFAELSIKRPTFISCVVILMVAVGYLSLEKMPVDLFPDVTFPVVVVNVPYPGAAPKEVETLVSKPLEEELSGVPGIKTLRSINKEGMSSVIAEFTLETDIKYAEQQVRDRVSSTKSKLPTDIKEPEIRRVDPADQPIIMMALTAELPEAQLYDVADEVLKPKLEQINSVGLVQIVGARKREIRVELDRTKLKGHEISASGVAGRIAAAGQNIPVGKVNEGKKETVFRALGEFRNLNDISSTIVSFFGNEVPTAVDEVGHVVDSLEDEKSRTYVNGEKGILLLVFRQSGANTIAVADSVRKKVDQLNDLLRSTPGKPRLSIARDASRAIRDNVTDVRESILIGILLTIIVVFFFLGNVRSTLITGLALPNSLLGAFILMAAFGFTVNIMTLLALSLTVGLLIDDAIVVRENIFRHMELGAPPVKAALEGTQEVALAVVATTMTVIAVFGPIGFLKGVVGQFFKQFGLTICFAMVISLFDAFTMAPMLSAYFAGKHGSSTGVFARAWDATGGAAARSFNRFQNWLENFYERVMGFAIRKPFATLLSAVLIFALSIVAAGKVPKTFLPPQDYGEFSIGLDMPPGTNLDAMAEVTEKVDHLLRAHPEVKTSVVVVGDADGAANVTNFFVELVSSRYRKMTTSAFKEIMREELKPFAYADPVVKDFDAVGAGLRPFNVNLIGTDLTELEQVATQAFEKIRKNPGLKDVEISYKPGKPEFQVALDNLRAARLGVSSIELGQELRAQTEGIVAAKFREHDHEYDIRVRLQDDQRNLRTEFHRIFIPNINNTLIRLTDVAQAVETQGPSNITRQDRGRYIQISGDLTPGGIGMGGVMKEIARMFDSGEVKMPSGMRYAFVGQAEDFKQLIDNMLIAMGLGVLFIYLVLASLYESFVTPFTIMLVLPLAACGAFFALFVTSASLDIFSMIGCVMLMGIATKNSILLVDYANQLIAQGMDRSSAIIKAGKTRLRPILMTTVALIAGMLPVAIGLNEASRQRTSMGISIIGGLISSTLLTLVVVPASFSYIDRFRAWSLLQMKRVFIG